MVPKLVSEFEKKFNVVVAVDKNVFLLDYTTMYNFFTSIRTFLIP